MIVTIEIELLAIFDGNRPEGGHLPDYQQGNCRKYSEMRRHTSPQILLPIFTIADRCSFVTNPVHSLRTDKHHDLELHFSTGKLID